MTDVHTPLALVAQLADALEERGISYCHWKSNTTIGGSETADNDLDLLVDRNQSAAFRVAGFSRVERQGKPLPSGKEDYIGFDGESGQLGHVDARDQLVLGHDRIKNYREIMSVGSPS